MYGIKVDMEDGAHEYLAQIPLTVSPFVTLPTATTLPYTYKSIPTAPMPPSSTGDDGSGMASASAAAATSSSSIDPSQSQKQASNKPKFVVSQSGHAAHPDDIVASCKMLATHVQKVQAEATQSIQQWQAQMRERELAEKRRVAPGWLDRNEKILEPVRKATAAKNVMDMVDEDGLMKVKGLVEQRDEEGEAMDRAFGGDSSTGVTSPSGR